MGSMQGWSTLTFLEAFDLSQNLREDWLFQHSSTLLVSTASFLPDNLPSRIGKERLLSRNSVLAKYLSSTHTYH
jgi:hypothetical protein